MTSGIDQQLNAFRSGVPLPDTATGDAIYRRVLEDRAKRRRPARPRRLALMVAVVALALTGGSLAAVQEVPWWQGGAPPVDPQSVVAVARDNLPAAVAVADARTVATDGDAALVAVPLDRTGYCLIPSFGGRASFGAQCVYSATGGDDVVRSAGRSAGSGVSGVWIVYGRIADRRAAAIDLGAFSAKLADGGFFVARVPADRWAALSGQANGGRVLDASGSTLRSGCVEWGGSPASSDNASSVLWSNRDGSCKPGILPAAPTVDLAAAKRILDVELAESYSIWGPGETVSFYAAPASDRSTCVMATGPGLSLAAAAAMPPGRGCRGTRVPRTPARALVASISSQLVHVAGRAAYVWSVSGSFDSRRVSGVELRTSDRDLEAAAADGFFFVQLDQDTAGPSAAPELPPGEHVLVAFDAAGREVGQLDLNALYRRARPH